MNSLFLPEESQASIMGDADSRFTGVSALAVIKFVLNLALKKMSIVQNGHDSQINNIGQLSHSTHTNISNQPITTIR